MKGLILTILLFVGYTSFGQSKVDIVLYPCGDKQIERAVNVSKNPLFEGVNITIISKCPSDGFPGVPTKVDFILSGTNYNISSIYSNAIPSNDQLIKFIQESNLFLTDVVINYYIKNNNISLAE